MEILAASPIMAASALTGILLLALIVSGTIFFICDKCDAEIGMIISGILCAIAGIALIISFAFPVESGEYKYTVEITEESKYKELINEGYTFKRVYDNREIYEITGAPLEEIEK